MNILRSKGVFLASCAVLLLVLFLVRPGANRLRTRIVGSISLAVGRPVEVSSVNLRLLPRPGFDLENFVVYDDPAFGAEPMLRSPEVAASLRLRSLFRGKIEMARLNLTDPSLNLVRNPDGHWNLEALLERASKTAVAPTGKSPAESRPGFPYIEASNARINFKAGPEKKPLAFTDTDFSFWQDSEDSWGMRLKGRAVHTDFNLSDTGTIRINGTWQRAAILRETPLRFSAQWENAQLGQLSKLVYGQDKGWRGSAQLSATLTGTPADLNTQADLSIQDFHRFDVAGAGPMKLAALCRGRYRLAERIFSDLTCSAPVGNGGLTLSGSIDALLNPRHYDLTLAAKNVPMQSLLVLVRHAKFLPDDLVATGKLDGNVKLVRDEKNGQPESTWIGSGETSDFQLRSQATDTAFTFGRIPIAFSSGGKLDSAKRPRNAPLTAPAMHFPAEPYLEVGPFNLALGRPKTAAIHGWFSRSGYGFVVRGDTQVQRLLQLAHMVGVPALQPAADGQAKVDLQIAGGWAGFIAPQASGDIQLLAIRAEVRGVSVPLEIASATVHLADNETQVQKLSASVDGTAWRGSLTLSRPCADPQTCSIRFDLHADEISTGRLNQWMNPNLRKQPWYHFLTFPSSPGTPFLVTLRASGTLHVDRALIYKLAAKSISANVDLQDGKLQLTDLRGNVLGGKHSGQWKADFTAKPPNFSGSGAFENVALDQLARAMHDGWIAGSAKATYEATASGLTAPELIGSTNATLQFEARDGALPHLSLADTAGPVRIGRFAGKLILSDGTLKLQQGKLQTRNGTYEVSGAASLLRTLQFKLEHPGARSFTITGTLAVPKVITNAPAPTVEAKTAIQP